MLFYFLNLDFNFFLICIFNFSYCYIYIYIYVTLYFLFFSFSVLLQEIPWILRLLKTLDTQSQCCKEKVAQAFKVDSHFISISFFNSILIFVICSPMFAERVMLWLISQPNQLSILLFPKFGWRIPSDVDSLVLIDSSFAVI